MKGSIECICGLDVGFRHFDPEDAVVNGRAYEHNSYDKPRVNMWTCQGCNDDEPRKKDAEARTAA